MYKLICRESKIKDFVYFTKTSKSKIINWYEISSRIVSQILKK